MQGLFHRPDEAAHRLPLGIVPGGSGNGLAKSLAHFDQENFTLFNSCLNVVKGHTHNMDLIKVTTTDRVLYSFLSIGYGFTSDTDIESECLRCLGEARFTIYSLKLLLELRSYRAKIAYKLKGSNSDTAVVTTEDDFIMVYCVKQPWVTSSMVIAPLAQLDDGIMWLILIRRGQMTRLRMLKIMLGFQNGNHVNEPGVEMYPVTYFKMEPLSKGSYITVDGEKLDRVCPLEAEIMPKAVKMMKKF